MSNTLRRGTNAPPCTPRGYWPRFLFAPRGCAANQIVTFQFYHVVLSDGSAATGTFDYDFTTKKAAHIALAIANGTFDNSAAAPDRHQYAVYLRHVQFRHNVR